MTDEHTGWAIAVHGDDYAIVHTTDAGRHWKRVSPSGFSPAAHGDTVYADEPGIDLATFGMKDAWTARVYGSQNALQLFVWRTTDAGLHWSTAKIPVSDTFGLFLKFVDSRHGFLLATSDAAMGHEGKRFYRTSDGGKTWRMVSDGFPGHSTRGALPFAGFPTGMSFHDAQNGWVGMSPRRYTEVTLFQTRDGGKTWRQQAVPMPAMFHKGNYDCDTDAPFFFSDGRQGALVLRFTQNNWEGVGVSRTQDGGMHWIEPQLVSTKERSVEFSPDGSGWITVPDQKSLVQTQDGGRNWKQEPTDALLTSLISNAEKEAHLDFVSRKVGWALVKNEGFGNDSVELLLTQDSGRHWRRLAFWPGTSAKISHPLSSSKKAGK
ncbi:MAG TPA: hypothetical protein VFW40_10465 [Capsulimonadaceae bacterium]|nr:hypothetical protein [Capsulimonadaceae bacterium]